MARGDPDLQAESLAEGAGERRRLRRRALDGDADHARRPGGRQQPRHLRDGEAGQRRDLRLAELANVVQLGDEAEHLALAGRVGVRWRLEAPAAVTPAAAAPTARTRPSPLRLVCRRPIASPWPDPAS